jgi:hypothetical protein
VLDLLNSAPEHGQAGLVVHGRMPHLGDDLGVALVATERVDTERLTSR